MQNISTSIEQSVYVIGPYSKPIATVTVGETITIETLDAFGNKITSAKDDITKLITLPFVNPLTGPIYIEGAEKGDTLVVTIHDIEVTRDYGVSALIPNFGGLCGTVFTRTLQPPLPANIMLHPINDGHVTFSEDLDIQSIPYEPFYGTIGTAPEIEAISSLAPGFHGGNMDAADACPGNKVLLPVNVPGALFHVGDGHAAQGDGEVCGTAIESPMKVIVKVNLIKNFKIQSPQFETFGPVSNHIDKDGYFVTTGIGPDLIEGARNSIRHMIDLLVQKHNIPDSKAYMFCSVCADLRISEVVDAPNWVVSCYFPKSVFN